MCHLISIKVSWALERIGWALAIAVPMHLAYSSVHVIKYII